MPQNKQKQSSDVSRQSSVISRQSSIARDRSLRDNQQIQDDNVASGESVDSRQTSGDAQQPIFGGFSDRPESEEDEDTGGPKEGNNA